MCYCVCEWVIVCELGKSVYVCVCVLLGEKCMCVGEMCVYERVKSDCVCELMKSV